MSNKVKDQNNTDFGYIADVYEPWDIAHIGESTPEYYAGMLEEIPITAKAWGNTPKEANENYQKFRKKKRKQQDKKETLDMTNHVRSERDATAPYAAMLPAAAVAGPLVEATAAVAPMFAPGTAGGNFIGNAAKDMLAYELGNRAFKTVTGTTPGELIRHYADYLSDGAIPEYFHNQVGGDVAYDLLTETPMFGLSAKAVPLVEKGLSNTVKTVANTVNKFPTYKAIGNNLLSQVVMEHPYQATKIYDVAKKYFPVLAKAFNQYVEDAARSQVNSGFGIDLSRRGSFLTPSVLPNFDPNSGKVLSLFDRARLGKLDLVDAVAEGRYTPYMTVSEKKAYILNMLNAADKASERVFDLNTPAVEKANTMIIDKAKRFNTYFSDSDLPRVKLYCDIVETTQEIGRSVSNPQDLILTARELGVSEEEFKLLRRDFLYKGTLDQLKRQIQALDSFADQQRFLTIDAQTLFTDKPRLVLEHKPLIELDGSSALGWAQGDEVHVTTKSDPRVLRRISRSPDPVSNPSFTGIYSHEVDHYALSKIPHVNDVLMYGNDYYVADPSNKSFMELFPEYSHGAFSSKWLGAPHELRSEVKNYIVDNNLPSDPYYWTPEQMKGYEDFINNRFKDFSDELYALTAGNSPLWNDMIAKGATPYEIAHATNGTRTPALLGLDMLVSGYKSGGTLNYLNYIK